jgi:hypothetical protein
VTERSAIRVAFIAMLVMTAISFIAAVTLSGVLP